MTDSIPGHIAFFVGMSGAFVLYFLRYKNSRLKKVVANFNENWKMIIFDLGFFLICGGLVTCFLVCPYSTREAFLVGCTWEGFVFVTFK
jgi:hypothetical protein